MPKTFSAWMQTLHFLVGVQATLGLVLFSVATFAVLFPETERWERSAVVFSGATGAFGTAGEGSSAAADLALARALHAEFGERFEQTPQRWMLGPADDARLEGADLIVRFYSPQGERRFRFDRTTRRLEIEREVIGVATFLNRIHQESLGRRGPGDSLWIWAWSLYLETLIVALFVLPVTGFCLWLSRPRPSRWAVATLTISLVLCVGVWAGLR